MSLYNKLSFPSSTSRSLNELINVRTPATEARTEMTIPVLHQQEHNHTLATALYASLAAILLIAALAWYGCSYRPRRKKIRDQKKLKACIYPYLIDFDVEDIVMRRAPTGGYNVTYSNDLAEGFNLPGVPSIQKSKSSDTRSTNSSGTHSTHGMEEAFDDEDGTIQVVEFSAQVNLEDGGKRTSMASIKEMSSWMRSYLEKEHDHVFDVEQEQKHPPSSLPSRHRSSLRQSIKKMSAWMIDYLENDTLYWDDDKDQNDNNDDNNDDDDNECNDDEELQFGTLIRNRERKSFRLSIRKPFRKGHSSQRDQEDKYEQEAEILSSAIAIVWIGISYVYKITVKFVYKIRTKECNCFSNKFSLNGVLL